MGSIQADKNYYRNFYFSGSCPKKFLKGVSILTVVFPIFIGLAYLNACRKERNYKNMCDKVRNSAIKVAILIPHVLQCLKEDDRTNFQMAFKKLGQDDQALFFKEAGKQTVLFDRALCYLPRDVKKIDFSAGDFPIVSRTDPLKQIANTKKFLKYIFSDASFQSLESLKINLEGVGCATTKFNYIEEIPSPNGRTAPKKLNLVFGGYHHEYQNNEDELYSILFYMRKNRQQIRVDARISVKEGETIQSSDYGIYADKCPAEDAYLAKGKWDQLDVSFLLTDRPV